MRMRIDPRLSDLAGSGLVLLAFLLVAMAVSAAPIVLRSMSARSGHTSEVTAPPAHAALG